MTPFINSVSRLVVTKPMPVPSTTFASCPRRLNGWKSCASLSADNPSPLSLTQMRMRSGVLVMCSTTTVPPTLLYLIALERRLMKTCFTRVRSAWTKHGISK